MIYGLSQYYNDELAGWCRAVTFYKEELRELAGKLALVLEQRMISSAHQKESSSFIDQLMVQQQEFDHIANQITSQQQRLERVSSLPGRSLEHPVGNKQDALRTRMHSKERNFTRLKYACAIFLASFIND